jgi:hypothetical protein
MKRSTLYVGVGEKGLEPLELIVLDDQVISKREKGELPHVQDPLGTYGLQVSRLEGILRRKQAQGGELIREKEVAQEKGKAVAECATGSDWEQENRWRTVFPHIFSRHHELRTERARLESHLAQYSRMALSS